MTFSSAQAHREMDRCEHSDYPPCRHCALALAERAYAEGRQAMIEEQDWVKDGVCIACGVDPVDQYAAGVASERERCLGVIEKHGEGGLGCALCADEIAAALREPAKEA